MLPPNVARQRLVLLASTLVAADGRSDYVCGLVVRLPVVSGSSPPRYTRLPIAGRTVDSRSLSCCRPDELNFICLIVMLPLTPCSLLRQELNIGSNCTGDLSPIVRSCGAARRETLEPCCSQMGQHRSDGLPCGEHRLLGQVTYCVLGFD